jgi:hypothetical protein
MPRSIINQENGVKTIYPARVSGLNGGRSRELHNVLTQPEGDPVNLQSLHFNCEIISLYVQASALRSYVLGRKDGNTVYRCGNTVCEFLR